eukprot:5356997-Amphidinium_carterae.1
MGPESGSKGMLTQKSPTVSFSVLENGSISIEHPASSYASPFSYRFERSCRHVDINLRKCLWGLIIFRASLATLAWSLPHYFWKMQ